MRVCSGGDFFLHRHKSVGLCVLEAFPQEQHMLKGFGRGFVPKNKTKGTTTVCVRSPMAIKLFVFSQFAPNMFITIENGHKLFIMLVFF